MHTKKTILVGSILLLTTIFFGNAQSEITHGPMLGHVTDSSVRVWGRTSLSDEFHIEYVPLQSQSEVADWSKAIQSEIIKTLPENDNSGWATIKGLTSETLYAYRIATAKGINKPGGTFKTLPNSEAYRNEYNPKGLYNFSFEYGSCAKQNSTEASKNLPTYTTMLNEVRDEVAFAVMNGDWLYEEKRDYPVSEWQKENKITNNQKPDLVKHAPTIAGVWENYKTYLSRAENLAEWHSTVPSYFTFDDHELVNDIWGAGSAGRRDRRAVFRDIGTAAWYDYLGWANPVEFKQKVHFGQGKMEQGSDILYDPKANFLSLDPNEISNLHVHWGTPTAGVDDIKLDVDQAGAPNSKVYDIVEFVDIQRVRVSPKAVANGTVKYSVGRRSYAKFSVGNCDYFLLDTRSHRQYHDTQNRDKPGLTLLGEDQKKWLKEEMAKSNADFFFLFSSVPFMIPHIGAGGHDMSSNKDESWTVFLDEREQLIDFWDTLEKPVFVLTGDLHNSFAIKITDSVWEFCSGPHKSLNHPLSDEGGRPTNGLYQFDKREMDIRWSSFALDDIPRTERFHPFYCVVQVNNVLNNPLKLGEERWVAYKHPQVIFKYYDGISGELRYAETVSTKR